MASPCVNTVEFNMIPPKDQRGKWGGGGGGGRRIHLFARQLQYHSRPEALSEHQTSQIHLQSSCKRDTETGRILPKNPSSPPAAPASIHPPEIIREMLQYSSILDPPISSHFLPSFLDMKEEVNPSWSTSSTWAINRLHNNNNKQQQQQEEEEEKENWKRNAGNPNRWRHGRNNQPHEYSWFIDGC